MAPNTANSAFITESKSFPASGVTSLSFGFQCWQTGTAAADLWIDDIAVDDEQIGCK